MNIILPPHNKISREVTVESLHCHIDEIYKMQNMIDKNKNLNGQKGFALAHCQISDDPYKIFVIKRKLFLFPTVIINAEILSKNNPYITTERCLSFPNRQAVEVERYMNGRVRYQNIALETYEENIDGLLFQIFQHEIQHFLGKDIYNN